MKALTTIPAFALFASIFLATSLPSQACFMRSPQPVQVWLDHVTVNITNQVAVKTYDCTFKNPNPRAVVGATCYMELEPGAQVDDMSVLVNGKETKAEILDVDKAKEVFQDIVKSGGSPALLEYYGSQLIQTQVPRIPANGLVKIRLQYTTVLKKKGNLIRMQLLNTNPKTQMKALKSASVTVNITSNVPIKNVYSPSHKVKLVETDKADISIQWSADNYLPKDPFVLYYSTVDDDVGATLLCHREEDEDGVFMLMVSPTMGIGEGKVTADDILPKDVVFCVDTSGSMLEDDKITQAKEALKYCLKALHPQDRFNIVNFSMTAHRFDKKLVKADRDQIAKALRYVDRLGARGGTAIDEALETSLALLETSDRFKMIVFATDGLPTIGERNGEAILKNVDKRNTNNVRIFTFGEGIDVNTKLLDYLALNHRGEADYILPNENIVDKISAFFDRVGSPIMTDLELDFQGLDVTEVYPRKIHDLYKGEQVIVYGRYKGSGQKTITLTGNVKGKRKALTYTFEFPKASQDDANAFVPRLWAGTKVDLLLNDMRASGKQDKELVDEVTYLAKRYGIITPYTSYLMVDDMIARPGTDALAGRSIGGELDKRKKNEEILDRALTLAPQAALKMVKESGARREYRDATKSGSGYALFAQAEKAMRGDADAASVSVGKKTMGTMRYIGARTFYSAANIWYDSAWDADKKEKLTDVKIGSDDYMTILKSHPRVAKYLALGNVVLKIKGEWYKFAA